MSDEKYIIYFEGKIIDGFAIGKVRKNLAALFKANEEKIDALFSSERVAVKKNLDRPTAEKYALAMANNGAQVTIVDSNGHALAIKTAEAATATPSPTNSPIPTDTQGNTDVSGSQWSLAPVGADLLKTGERKEVTVTEVDVSHLSLESLAGKGKAVFGAIDLPNAAANENSQAQADATASDAETTQRQAQDSSGLSIADVGAMLSDKPKGDQPLPEFNVSDISIAELGVDLVPDRPQGVAAVAPSTDHITLAEDNVANG